MAPTTTAPGSTTPTESSTSSTSSTAPTTTTIATRRIVDIVGHGWGHGRGLGQWGAYGYAVDFGWGYRKILDHYYGKTVAGAVAPQSAIGVRLTRLDAKALTVYHEKGRCSRRSTARSSRPCPTACPVDTTTPGRSAW